MCGVVGILNVDNEPASTEAVRKMALSVAHRGPDGEGVFSDGALALGHRRLSIIDLSSAAKQPMSSDDGRFVVSYNGELYNFRDLREELTSLGHNFQSESDTEVLLKSWVQWGEFCVSKFNGMFAFAIWDRAKGELFLVRDRYGIKPLYYGSWDSTFLFGSEQKAILAHPSARREVDKEALLEYFTFQNIFTDKTLLKNINILQPGCIAKVSLLGSVQPEISRYWDYRFREPEISLSAEEYREGLDYLLRQAVSRQLVSDVEVGSYLSGGMDSGTLTALAARELPHMKTFTCGFDLSSASGIELLFDERVRAEAMSAQFKTEHYEMVLKAGDMERCLPRLAEHIEEPRVGQSYPNYYAAQLAGKFVKVVLSGAGGDELFGGYPWRYYRASGCKDFEDYIDQYYQFWQRLIPNSEIQQVFSPIWNDVKHVWTRDIFRNVFLSHDNELEKPEDFINHSLYFEAKTFLHGLFVIEDKISMSHGLEVRVPFMDNDLVDFAMSCPVSLKLNNLSEVSRINENESGRKTNIYYQRTNDGKQILRDVMRKYIPSNITEAQKQGFSAPDASWFKGESIDFVRRKLFNGNANIYEFLDRDAVQSLVGEHLSGHKNRRLLIWSLLNMDEWLGQMSNVG